MNRRELMLAVLAAPGRPVSFEPVQVQKLFFLIDREIPNLVGGPHFGFRPYDYGPFDSAVYMELEDMSKVGLVQIVAGYYRSYLLTADGYERGTAELGNVPEAAKNYILAAVQWVRGLSFSQLVSAIYKEYPDMKTASVFRE